MEQITVKTLVDITNTNVRRINQGTQQELDQYRNWTTLKQVLELRSLFTYDHNPQSEIINLTDMGFGTAYKGEHRVWTFVARPDRAMSYYLENQPVGLLIADLHQIPIIKNLTETINIAKPVFDLTDVKTTNTVVWHS